VKYLRAFFLACLENWENMVAILLAFSSKAAIHFRLISFND